MRSVLADFSRVVRESTIKRLTLTPKSFENWKITENAMSIADIAQHLVDTDEWLFDKLSNPQLKPITGKTGSVHIKRRDEFKSIIEKLRETGEKRYEGILDRWDYNQMIYDSRFNGKVSVLWIVIRGNLDHEIHHRGQLSAYLRVIQDSIYEKATST